MRTHFRTHVRLILLVIAAGALIYWLLLAQAGGLPEVSFDVPVVNPPDVGLAVTEPVAVVATQPVDTGILDCARVDVHHRRGAMYQMDGPLGLASGEEIATWHGMGRDEQITFLEECQHGTTGN